MEFLIAAAIAGVAFTLPSAHFLVFTLMFLWLMAFSSATHDIAADGFLHVGARPARAKPVCRYQKYVLPHRYHSGQRTAHHAGGHVGNFHPSHRLFVEHRFLRAGGILHCRDRLPLFSTCRAPTATGHEKPYRPVDC